VLVAGGWWLVAGEELQAAMTNEQGLA